MNTFVTKDRRTFLCIGTEPYQRKDGRWTKLAVWQGSCRVCGGPYTVRTRYGLEAASNSFNLVHCPKHRFGRARNEG